MKNFTIFMAMLLFSAIVIPSTKLLAQEKTIAYQDWTSDGGVEAPFRVVDTQTDSNSNSYVLGMSVDGTGDYDILLIKLNMWGLVQWTESYNGSGNGMDIATGMHIDGNDDIFITGSAYTNNDKQEIVTLKYNPSGTLQWAATFDGGTSEDESGGAITTDGNGNVYVTGTVFDNTTYYDMVVLKYNSSGTLLWDENYDFDGGLDVGSELSYNSSTDEIIISGAGHDMSIDEWRFVTATYTDNGTFVDDTQSMYSSELPAEAFGDMTRDLSGNYYVVGTVTGSGNKDIRVAKFNSSLQLQWEETFNSPHDMNDGATAIVVNNSGEVFVGGYVETDENGTDYVLIKYNNSGAEQWAKYHDGYGSGADTLTALTIGLQGDDDVYATGSSFNGNDQDYHTMRYASNGEVISETTFDRGLGGNDSPRTIAWTAPGEVIVSGSSFNGTADGLMNVKYNSANAFVPADITPTSSSQSYVLNNGQVLDTDGNAANQIKYKMGNVFISDTAFSIVQARIDTAGNDTLHRVDFVYDVTGSPNVLPVTRKQEYSNYYKGTIKAVMTPHYEELYISRLTRSIDARYSSNAAGFKVQFITRSSLANLGNLDIDINGADSIAVDNDDLVVYTSLGEIRYPQARASQVDTNGDMYDLNWQPDYEINGNTLSFTNIGFYDTNKELIFTMEKAAGGGSGEDENLLWSTYFGGSNIDYLVDVKAVNNHIWVTGFSASEDFPTLIGHQEIIGGDYGFLDATLTKFTEEGEMKWSTFFGGSDDEGYNYNQSITVSNDGVSTLYGGTLSQDIYLLELENAYFDDLNDCSQLTCHDTYIARFSNSGVLEWSTYFGGFGGIGNPGGATLDSEGNLFIVGNDENIDLEDPGNDAHFQTQASGNAFVAKFSPSGELVWSTYFGGNNGNTFIKGVKTDSNDNLFITGITSSTSGFPLEEDGGYYQANNGGGVQDVFLTKFSGNNYEIVWSTYFGGKGLDNIHKGLNIDQNDNIFLCGCTEDEDDFPLVNSVSGGYYQDEVGGTSTMDIGLLCNGDAFISRFNGTGQLIHSTLYGAESTDVAQDVFTHSGMVYVILYTGSDNLNFAYPNLENAFISENHADGSDESLDGFILALDYDFNLVWTTYFGGAAPSWSLGGIDIPYSMSISNNDNLFMVGTAWSTQDFPLVDPGSPAWFKGNPIDDAFISKFSIDEHIVNIEEVAFHNSSADVKLFPNPTDALLTVLTTKGSNIENIELYDIGGRRVSSFTMSGRNNMEQINLSNFRKGVYFIQINSNNDLITKKIILQ